jgi:hypothetical protein
MFGAPNFKRKNWSLVPGVELLEGRFTPSAGAVAGAPAAHAAASVVGPVFPGPATPSNPGSTTGAILTSQTAATLTSSTITTQGALPTVGVGGVGAALDDFGIMAASVGQVGTASPAPAPMAVGTVPGTLPTSELGAPASPAMGLSLGVVPGTAGTAGIGAIPGSSADGAFGVGTFTGNGDIVGGTQPSPVTGTTGAGVFTGLDTFGIGDGFGAGYGIQRSPDGAGLLY